MKIGILTFHRSVNYGAYLQAMALCKRLNCEPDITAEIIDFRMKCDENHYKYCFQTKHPRRILYKLCLNHTFKKSAELLPKSTKADFTEFSSRIQRTTLLSVFRGSMMF